MDRISTLSRNLQNFIFSRMNALLFKVREYTTALEASLRAWRVDNETVKNHL
jgi:hypothetical protein